MDNHQKTINLFGIIFMGYICVEKKVKAPQQSVRTPGAVGYDIMKPAKEMPMKKTVLKPLRKKG